MRYRMFKEVLKVNPVKWSLGYQSDIPRNNQSSFSECKRGLPKRAISRASSNASDRFVFFSLGYMHESPKLAS